MGKESRIDAVHLSPLAQRKFQELVSLLSEEEFGPEGPPRETDFATIEEFGHQAGRSLARALDEHLTRQHAKHFEEEDCPTCGVRGESSNPGKERPLQTRDGSMTLAEPAFHCERCGRAFFPSADRAED
jgi:hypothetical protein